MVYEKSGTCVRLALKNQYGYDSTATLVLTIRDLSASTTIPMNLNSVSIAIHLEGDHHQKRRPVTVHLLNAVGCDSAATADVVISPKIAYVSPQILLQTQPIAAITPQNLGGKVLNYTIQPSLVKGLQFNAGNRYYKRNTN